MKTKFLVSAITILVLFSSCAAKQEETISIFAMGTYMTFTAYGNNAAESLVSAQELITELETLISATDINSEIYKVNNIDSSFILSDTVAELLQLSLEISHKTNGAFDPTVFPLVHAWGFDTHDYRIPTDSELMEIVNTIGYSKVNLKNNSVNLPDDIQIDLGGIGKGYAGDKIAEFLIGEGISSALLDIGGNIHMIGRKSDGTKWRLGIRNPMGDGSVGVLETENCAVVTSGGYERYFIGDDNELYWHILDPKTGKPSNSGLVSVTIISEYGWKSDALSTALFVMGLDESIEFWRTERNFEMLLITEMGEIYLTENIKDDFTSEYYSFEQINVISP